MRTTEILELLKANPGSYVERAVGTYCIKGADGARMVGFEPVHQQIDDLIEQFRLRSVGTNRYVLAE